MQRTLFSVTLLLAALFSGSFAGAQATESYVPAPLQPWVPWVLEENPSYQCTWLEGSRTCDWPGVLELRATSSGATFSQKLEVDRRLTVALPGDTEHWPEEVRANGKAVAIENSASLPFVTLPKGSHTLTGRFTWPTLPDGLRVPSDVARVELWVDGEQLRFARRSAEGKIWLAKSSEVVTGSSRDGVELGVYRKLIDGIPLRLETVIVVRASGRARELNLGNVLPKQATPMSVTAGLPVQVHPESGELRLQLRAGTHEVRLEARFAGDVRSFQIVDAPNPWPDYEIWSWESNEALRQVELGGAPGVDPARTSMPQEWRALPAFTLSSGQMLKLDVLRRGQSSQPPNQLYLARQMWLELSGDAFTVRDQISGSMKQDWRLDLHAAPLGHVALSGEDQLITQSPIKDSKATGIEVRDGNVDLSAEWRLKRTANLPAVGWSQDMQGLTTTLHLPPGWSLLAASGVDSVPNTWIARWNVYGFFFVFLIALAIGKLVGWRWLPVALVGFVLAYHEPDMPLVVWVVLLVFLALLKVLPEGVWRTLTEAGWAITAIVLVFLLAPFLVTQFREAIYPQIEDRYAYDNSVSVQSAAKPVPPAAEPLVEKLRSAEGAATDMAEELLEAEMVEEDVRTRRDDAARGVLGPSRAGGRSFGGPSDDSDGYDKQGFNYRAQQKSLLQQDPNAVISTGPGIYNWRWNMADLSWSGPVTKDHKIQLWLISPTINLLLTVIRLGCLLVLAIVLLLLHPWRKPRQPKPSTDSRSTTTTSAAAASAIALLFLTFGSSAKAQSPIPSEAMLDELQARVTKAPDCDSECVEMGTASLRIKGDSATLELEVHAATDTAVSLPGPAKSWVPDEVRVDGRTSAALRLNEGSGFIQLKISAGTHKVLLSGGLPPEDSITLEFAEQPHRVEVSAPDWEVVGLRADGRINGSLQLQRRMNVQSDSGRPTTSQLPPWFTLTRRLEIGTRWTVTSTLERQTPMGSPEVVRIPLLPGESVTESELEIENGELVISMGRDEVARTWSSSLTPTKSVTLTAAKGRSWSEAWQLTCGPIWRCTAGDSLAPVAHLSGSQWSPVYRPWPGEELTLTFVQPKGVKGETSTIDNATLNLRPGSRQLSAELNVTIRTSQGGPHKWKLPKDAAVQSLTLNHGDIPIEVREGVVQTTLVPGQNTVGITWQQNQGMDTSFSAPKVSLGSQAVNLRTEIVIPEDRWLIWAEGPDWGPAILFWSHFFLILVLALVASRIPRSPLRIHEWILLGLGLTQVPTWVALLLAGWFFALAYRRAHPFEGAVSFNATQLGLAFYTLVALVCFYAAVHTGLLVNPDWQVSGQDSYNGQLNWYQDRSDGQMPSVSVISLPLGWWRGIMLVWALWLAWKLLSWLRWAWASFSEGGRWKKFRKRPRPLHPAGSTRHGPQRAATMPVGVASDPPPRKAPPKGRVRKSTPKASLPPAGLGFALPDDDEDWNKKR